MFEELKAKYDAWVKGKWTKVVQGVDQIAYVSLWYLRSTPARDRHQSTRWYQKEGDKLGDKPHGYRQGDLERSR